MLGLVVILFPGVGSVTLVFVPNNGDQVSSFLVCFLHGIEEGIQVHGLLHGGGDGVQVLVLLRIVGGQVPGLGFVARGLGFLLPDVPDVFVVN